MSKAVDFYRGLNESITNAIAKVTPFRAMVSAVLGGKVQIQPLEASEPLAEPYARLSGFKLAPNDEVAVVTISGKPFVLGRIQRSTPTGETFDQPIKVETSSDTAFVVGRSGTNVFRVDTNPTSNVGILNGVHLSGFANDGSGQASWNIDSGSGSARFDGNLVVAGEPIAPPIVRTGYFSDPSAVYSTTNTATDVVVMSDSTTLPAGTWTGTIIAGASFKNSANGIVRSEVRIGASGTGTREQPASSAEWSPFVISHTATGLTGFQNWTYRYRSSGTATTTMRNWWYVVIFVRTA